MSSALRSMTNASTRVARWHRGGICPLSLSRTPIRPYRVSFILRRLHWAGTVCDASAAQMCQSNWTIWFSTKKPVINFIPVLCCFNKCEFSFSASSFRASVHTLHVLNDMNFQRIVKHRIFHSHRESTKLKWKLRMSIADQASGNAIYNSVMLINCFRNAALNSTMMRTRKAIPRACNMVRVAVLKLPSLIIWILLCSSARSPIFADVSVIPFVFDNYFYKFEHSKTAAGNCAGRGAENRTELQPLKPNCLHSIFRPLPLRLAHSLRACVCSVFVW